MKAAILEAYNEPLVVDEVLIVNRDLPAGQVGVDVEVSGLCGAQLQEISGEKPAPLPHLLGHEGVGYVREISPGVSRVKVGDKVVMHWRKGIGIESDFPVYHWNGKPFTSGKVTTLSEYSIVSENRLTPVPADLDNDFAALLGCGLSTALGIADRDIKAGDTVMIVGMGGVGACCVVAARYAGAGYIIEVDRNTKPFLSHGRMSFYTPEQLLSNPYAVADVIINTTGNTESISDTLPLLAPGGRYIIVGQPKPGHNVIINNARHLFEGEGKTIKATQGGGFQPSSDIQRYVRDYQQGRIDTKGIVSHRFKLEEINSAIDLMRAGGARRIMIDL